MRRNIGSKVEASNISAIIVASCTVVYTIGTLFLWYLTNRNVSLIKQQIEIQNATSRSSTWHSVIDGHRELYLELISNENLLETYCKETGLEPHLVRKKYLATLMVNHALRIYLDYSNNLDIPEDLQSYITDLHSMLQTKFIRERWVEIRNYYPASFRSFVDQVKISPKIKS